MTSYVLGVDIGTGSVKAVALTSPGEIIGSVQHYYPTQHPQPGYAEQDPTIVLEAFIKCIHEIVSKLKSPPTLISLSSAMHSLMPVNEACIPLTNLLLWSDSRSADIARRIRNSPQAELIYTSTGTPIHSMSPLCKIIWLKENSSALYQQAYKFISVKEYIWYQLFHEFKIDHSLASGTGLFDIKILAWNDTALSIAGLSADKLSETVTTDYIQRGIIKKLAALLNIPVSTPFCIGASDGCLANLGSHVMRAGEAALTIGTSAAVRITRTAPLHNFSMMNFNYILDKEHFICGTPVNNGGNILQWLLKQFLAQDVAQDDYQRFFERIEKIPAGCDGLIFLPLLHGERAPIWDDQSSGVFFGIRSHHHQDHFLRAGVEGVCFALKNILSMLEAASGPVHRINVSGGFVHSSIWMQMLADITGKKLCRQQSQDASAMGAAYLGMKAINLFSNYSVLENQTQNYICPRADDTDVYMKNYQIFKTLYPSLKDAMHLQ